MWPPDFARIPDEEWVAGPIETLARKYDTVEHHGWYRNLEPTVAQVAGYLRDGHRMIDYSGGTGILIDRILAALPAVAADYLLVDSSPKFLRLAVDKLGGDPRVAFRLIRFLRDARRLELLDEVVPASLMGGFDALTSTNAIHLYYDLPDTLASWRRALRGGALAFVQSGNVRNPDAPAGSWIIDETVERVHRAAVARARDDVRFRRFADVLGDPARMRAHDEVRVKYFLPVRPLGHYTAALEAAGFAIVAVEARPIEARVDEWFQFLAAYHDGVLGWAGGTRRVEGADPDDETVALRLELIRASLDDLFAGAPTFVAAWTYLTCRAA